MRITVGVFILVVVRMSGIFVLMLSVSLSLSVLSQCLYFSWKSEVSLVSTLDVQGSFQFIVLD